MRIKVVAWLTCVWPCLMHGQTAMVDESFRPELNNIVYSAKVENDRIVVAGAFSTVNGESRRAFVRLNMDGTTDTSFNVAVNASVLAFDFDDEKYVISGRFTSVNSVPCPGLACLNKDGSLITTFKAAYTPSNYYDVLLQADGKVIFPLGRNLIRLHPDGSHDTNLSIRVLGGSQQIMTVVRASEEKFLIGGSFTEINISVARHVARLWNNGQVDYSFNAYGQVIGSYVSDIAPLPNGHIFIGGNMVARLDEKGRIDPTFAVYATTYVRALTAQPDEKLIIGGTFDVGPYHYINRRGRDGNSDPMFVQGDGANNLVYSTALQSDWRILVGGTFTYFGGVQQPYLVRLLNDFPVLEQEPVGGTDLRHSWPSVYTNFVLHASPSLTETNWMPVQQTPVTNGSRMTLTNEISSGNAFFRLLKR